MAGWERSLYWSWRRWCYWQETRMQAPIQNRGTGNKLYGETTLMLQIIIVTSGSCKSGVSSMSCRQHDLLLRGSQLRIQNIIILTLTDAPSGLAKAHAPMPWMIVTLSNLRSKSSWALLLIYSWIEFDMTHISTVLNGSFRKAVNAPYCFVDCGRYIYSDPLVVRLTWAFLFPANPWRDAETHWLGAGFRTLQNECHW